MIRSRAAVMPAPGSPVEVLSLELPDIARGGAILDVRYSEVCGTDVHLHHGRLAGVPYPVVPGHVTVGHLSSLRGDLRTVDGEPLGNVEVTFHCTEEREAEFRTFKTTAGAGGEYTIEGSFDVVVMNPDGTKQRAIYGSNSWYPNSSVTASPIRTSLLASSLSFPTSVR